MGGDHRVRALEEELGAARKVIDSLVRRAERQAAALTGGPDQFAALRALANLEAIADERSRELNLSEARYRALYESSPDMVFTVDDQGDIIATNQTALTAFDCEPAALVGCSLASLFDDDARSEVDRWIQQGFQGVSDEDLLLDDGRIVSATAGAVTGLVGHAQVVLRDVTARRKLEHELAEARRLAAIGHLAAGVAHEINNPLTVIQLRLEYLRGLEVAPELLDQFRILADHAHRIARIVRNLQGFARSRDVWVVIPVEDLVASAAKSAGPVLGGLTVDLDLEADLAVEVHPGRAEQVLVNLLTNAADVLSDDGRIRICAREEDGRISLSVQDDGPGIPEALIADLFTPFATSSNRTGSGLGLATAWAIVQEHGGSLHARNGTDGGACFHFTLPKAPGTAAAGTEATPIARPLRVLCIDDEPALLQVLKEFVTPVGHGMVTANSAEEALEILSADPHFDVVLSDLRLPGMNGRELLEIVERDHPELAGRTVLMSGFFRSTAGEVVRTLQKPFVRRDLLDLLEEFA